MDTLKRRGALAVYLLLVAVFIWGMVWAPVAASWPMRIVNVSGVLALYLIARWAFGYYLRPTELEAPPVPLAP